MLGPLIRGFGRSPDAARLIPDPPRLRRMQWQVFVAITFGYGFFYVCRLSLNVIKKPLIDSGAFDAGQLGAIGSALFFSYAVAKLVNGVLVDHANIRRFMAAGLVVSALINLTLGSLPGFWTFLLLWGANGWFQSMGAPACIVAIARWFPTRGRGIAYGVWSTSHNIGEALTFVVTGAIVGAFGAAWGLRAAGLIGLVAAVMVMRLLHERPEIQGLPAPDDDPAATPERPAATPRAVAALQWAAARNPRVWLLALASGFFYVTRYAINSWGVFFLQEHKGYDALQAASIISVNAVAGIVGTFCSGFISDRLCGGSRHLPAFVFGLVYLLATALFVLSPRDPVVDTAIMVLFGIATGVLLTFVGGLMAIELVDRSAAGMVSGIVGIASYLGAGVQDLTSGRLIQAGRSVAGGQVHYDFSQVGALWIGAAALSCVLALAAWRPAKPRPSAAANPLVAESGA